MTFVSPSDRGKTRVCVCVQVGIMSREQVSITELLLLLDSPELLQVEQVRAELNHLLSTGECAGVSAC